MNEPVLDIVPPVFLSKGVESFDFFQLIRLLRRQFSNEHSFNDSVRVRPSLDLAFPTSDVQDVCQDEQGIWRVTASFFGLYGVSSPLPTFYGEDIINEHQDGRMACRAFLDIFHAAMYSMLFASWEKYRLWLKISEYGDNRQLSHLFALIGRSGFVGSSPHDARFLPLASFFTQRRSALSLEAFVRACLGEGAVVDVEPCSLRTINIPRQARCILGCTAARLGDVLLGEYVAERSSTATIYVGPLDADRFNAMLPGGRLNAFLAHSLSLYVTEVRQYLIRLRINANERRLALCTLGEARWSRLGLDIWLGTPAIGDIASVCITLDTNVIKPDFYQEELFA